MQFDVTVLRDVQQLQRLLTPTRYWAALERILPRALAPALVAMKTAAPRGRSGKLARGFDLRLQRIQQGLVHGLQVDVGARVPYGHLVHGGHKIIARGRGRGSHGAVIGTKQVTVTRHALLLSGQEATRQEVVTRNVRSTRAAELTTRRAAGAIGRVAGNPFAAWVLQQRQAQTVGLVEKLLQVELTR